MPRHSDSGWCRTNTLRNQVPGETKWEGDFWVDLPFPAFLSISLYQRCLEMQGPFPHGVQARQQKEKAEKRLKQ